MVTISSEPILTGPVQPDRVKRNVPSTEIPQMAPPVADDGSTKGVRTTISVVNRRDRSGSAPYQADLAIENQTH